MRFKSYYHYFNNAIPKKICDDIIKTAKQYKKEKAYIDNKKKAFDQLDLVERNNLKDFRDSNIVWLNEKWIYNEILPYINDANQNAGWNFQWDWAETAQFTIYKPGEYYNWHYDCFPEPYKNNDNNRNYAGKIRKLSVTVLLSDPKDYVGGELEFDYGEKEISLSKKGKTLESYVDTCRASTKGSVIVFPSHIYHRVKPIIKGTRYSLVIWCLGWPFH